jgi:N-acetylmuramoyl-L-alanine amidase
MNAKPYDQLSDLVLLELCVWREARGESFEAKRAVAWVIHNRTIEPKWWNGHIAGSISRVVLYPWQFSSFNQGDINHDKWPYDDDPSFAECCAAALPVYMGSDKVDPTNGATAYYDTSITFPKAWGEESDWENTLNVGRLRFWKLKPVLRTTAEEVTDASVGD